MSGLSKRDAMKLVADIAEVNLMAHAFAERTAQSYSGRAAYFIGGMESLLQHFLEQQGCREAASAFKQAMNYAPTQAEIAAHNAKVARLTENAS